MLNTWYLNLKINCISKFELLTEIADIYDKDIEIKLDASVVADKCLIKGKQRNPITIQLKELKEFYGYWC